jgi:serine/threonine-protein kinase
MIYCPECGSQVAPDDAFCPYCGISMAVNPANVPAELPPSEVTPPTTIESSPIEPPKTEISDPIPPSPFAPSEDFESPIAHLTDMNETFPAEAAQPELPPVSPLPETPVFFEDLPPAEEKVEPFELPSEIIVPSMIETKAEEISEAVSVPPVFEDEQEQIETREKVEIPPVEPPFESENQPAPAEFADSFETPVSKILASTDEVDEFSATIPNMAENTAQNELDLGEFSIEPATEIVAETPQPEIELVVEAPPAEIESAEAVVSAPLPEKPSVEVIPTVAPETPFEASLKAVEEVPPIAAETSLAEKLEAVEEEMPMVESVESPEAVSIPEIEETPQAVPIVPNVEESQIAEATENENIPIVEENPISAAVKNDASSLVGESEKVEIPESIPTSAVSVAGGAEIEDKEKESRAYTNPNIAVGIDTDGRNKAKLKPLDEGTILNQRYQIERKIGGGGMGAVYLAKDNNLGGVKRAVKEMVQSYIEEEQQEKAISDFKRESELLTALDHPAIPTIFDYFFDEKENRFYLVMKYISGGDLAGRLRAAPEGRLDEVTVTDWAIQIADVLDYLHRHDPPIIYRDLKPSNVMIDGNTGKVMMIDFGIARTVHKEEKGVTAVGTMGYAPPELFSGNVEPSSDIYSLGSTMFHLLTGADPQSNPLLIFDFNKNPRPRQINPQLSDQIEQILMRAVEYNSGQRFVTAAEMRDALNKHMENLRKGAVTFGVVAPNTGMQSASSIAVFCGFCGQKIVATDMFCPFCGAQQPTAAQSSQNLPTPPVFAAPKLTARLLVVGTNDLEQNEYSLEKDSNLLGRRDPMSNIFPEVDLSKYDPQTKISRRHARIWRENEMFMLEDLGSSNGTILTKQTNESNRLLPRQPHVLTNGDKIRVGDTTLRFTLG